jgi:hypothetical protein
MRCNCKCLFANQTRLIATYQNTCLSNLSPASAANKFMMGRLIVKFVNVLQAKSVSGCKNWIIMGMHGTKKSATFPFNHVKKGKLSMTFTIYAIIYNYLKIIANHVIIDTKSTLRSPRAKIPSKTAL